jgi:hypothetical protein
MPKRTTTKTGFVDPTKGNKFVARCHTFLKKDQTTIAASGLPDPKHIAWKEHDYHLTKKEKCAYCQKGIDTWSRPWARSAPCGMPDRDSLRPPISPKVARQRNVILKEESG